MSGLFFFLGLDLLLLLLDLWLIGRRRWLGKATLHPFLPAARFAFVDRGVGQAYPSSEIHRRGAPLALGNFLVQVKNPSFHHPLPNIRARNE
jgi:hypothetical protein